MSYSPTASIARGSSSAPDRDLAKPVNPPKKTYNLQVVLADTEALRRKAFHLRYQVYCIENAFEPIAENPGEMETDEYDQQSLHCLLVRRPSNVVVGTTRLILPKLNGSAIPLPIRRICPPPILERYAHIIPPGKAAEISRFAIVKQHRRRTGDRNLIVGGPAGMGGSRTKRVIPHISLGLMQAVVAMAAAHDVTHLYAVMEPALLRMLQFLGIYFHNLGPVVDYHGWRQPCFCDLDHLLATTYAKRPDVWNVLTDHGGLWPLNSGATAQEEALIS